MPIVAHNQLPSFDRLRMEGINVLPSGRAAHQHIRELHIGLLNMMPDQALEATERQFLRLLTASNHIAQFYVHLFTMPELARSDKTLQHIEHYYESFDKIKEQGLDALIITGANITCSDLSAEPFWNPLIEVVDWARDQVTSTLCSCLASHAVLDFHYGLTRQRQPDKIWGVFPHKVVNRNHPMVKDINTRFDVPHSRWNSVTRQQFNSASLPILVESTDREVHLATSHDGLRLVFFQGHPEFDTVSLLKEYKRELVRYFYKETDYYPPIPDNVFGTCARAILDEYKQRLVNARAKGASAPEFPERFIIPSLDNTWHDTAEAVVGHWIGLVYQLTNKQRNRPFMDGVDPNDPLSSLVSR